MHDPGIASAQLNVRSSICTLHNAWKPHLRYDTEDTHFKPEIQKKITFIGGYINATETRTVTESD